jgi:hypothetical protein
MGYSILVRKPEGERPLGRPRRIWEDNIKLYLREIGCRLNLSGSGKGPMAVRFEDGNELLGSIKGGDFLE